METHLRFDVSLTSYNNIYYVGTNADIYVYNNTICH